MPCLGALLWVLFDLLPFYFQFIAEAPCRRLVVAFKSSDALFLLNLLQRRIAGARLGFLRLLHLLNHTMGISKR